VGGTTLVVMHELYPSKRLDAAGTGRRMRRRDIAQLDELLVTLGASEAVMTSSIAHA
jgi:hypothetical protein